MSILAIDEPKISAAVDRYIDLQKRSGRPVSTREAVQALRTEVPKCYVSDRCLADLVAASAVENGQNVVFDLTLTEEPTTSTPPRTT